MTKYAVIMAGGVGSRFWPRSREKNPKQLLKIIGENSMIADTVNRLEGIVERKNIFVVTNRLQKEEMLKQLTGIPKENIIEEPFGRNTAPCIGLAALFVDKVEKDGVMIVLPADHLIQDKEIFRKTLTAGAEYAYELKGLVTIGIPPTRPETGYGYIQIDDRGVKENLFKVYTFAEKPNLATAERFLESGDFLWNSGMFIWRADTILTEMQMFMPELYKDLMGLKKFLGTPEFAEKLSLMYGQLRGISIDYGIMEKSHKVYLIKGEFAWSDVGSWEEVYQLTPKDGNGNAVTGKVFLENTKDSFIYSPDKFTAVIGAENLLVINTPDALLVCKREMSQDVKKVVDHLKFNKMNEYL
ncbi:MAG: mannose-1-phosphate guanylyltransferase [Ignavibacteriaceae bacterium]